MKARRNEGQILVLMALLSTTLIILFGMVVSIGHLVQAKINLQNAVDLASMSGASWQARYLNNISLINYRMRQNYKFVLYDLYVTQSRFNVGLKKQLAGATTDILAEISKSTPTFGICQQARGFCGGHLPSQYNENPDCTAETTDMCRNVDTTLTLIPPIIPSPVVNLNPALIAANALIAALGQQAAQYCRAAHGQNNAYFSYITDRLNGQEKFQMNEIAKVLTSMNSAFGDGNEVSGNGGWADATMAVTFQKNLIAANAGAKLEYLNGPTTRKFALNDFSTLANDISGISPPGGSFSTYFERQTVRFEIRIVDFNVVGGTGCQPTIKNAQYPSDAALPGVFLGLSRARNPNNQIIAPLHIALKATVQPHLLFWPIGFTPTLTAVGAAKPFGSRIGPSAEQSAVEVTGNPNSRDYSLANMSFYPGDVFDPSSATISGVGHKVILQYLLGSLYPNQDSGRNEFRPSIINRPPDCSRSISFMCLALAPTLYEGLFWNVFPYPEIMTTVYGAVGAAIGAASPNQSDVPDQGMQVAEGSYYAMPDRNVGPTSGNVDDWHQTTLISNRVFSQNNQPVFFASPDSAMSSFSPSVDPATFNNLGSRGRIGYQIKLVSLNQLCQDVEAGGNQVDLGSLKEFCSNGSTQVFH